MDSLHSGLAGRKEPEAMAHPMVSGAFFSGCWDIVGLDLLKVASALFLGCPIPRAFTTSLICLIPKGESPNSFTDFRLISLCNCVYKILAKIISGRLARVLPNLISLEQGAFVQGRSMTENIALAQEVLGDINRKVHGGSIVLKVDMEKAYDRIEWSFLRKVLGRFVNGELADFFKSTRGVRQGYPLSPSLYILAAEVLNRGFTSLMDRGSCLAYQVGRNCSRISLFLYIDDTLLFLSGGLKSVRATKSFLDYFQKVLGQKINLQKSGFINSDRLSSARVDAIQRILRMAKASANMIYLGVPVVAGRRKGSEFQPLVDKVDSRVNGWQSKCLTMASRATLIQHVLSSIPVHSLAAAGIPASILKALESHFASFFWGWADSRRKHHWRKWSEIAAPKAEGGLGFRELAEVIQVLRLKMAWAVRFKGS
ncbi:uncharacterized protein LOC131217324 [Magnolia sinica]|uniref:uncharacterized protein LOC131217324 n=1 Tax=Magnolia sinica TaxID=86752 RepID=UPI002659D28F|nr:uncharacterized protein LOC131217324 [Magnolia sinica]